MATRNIDRTNTIEFMHTNADVRYLSIDDYKERFFEEISEMYQAKKKFTDQILLENNEEVDFPLPMLIGVLYEDNSAGRWKAKPKNDAEMKEYILVIKKAINEYQSKAEKSKKIKFAVLFMEAWASRVQLTDHPEYGKRPEAEIVKELTQQFKAGKIERHTMVLFNWQQQVSDSGSTQMYTIGDLETYKLFENHILIPEPTLKISWKTGKPVSRDKEEEIEFGQNYNLFDHDQQEFESVFGKENNNYSSFNFKSALEYIQAVLSTTTQPPK